MVSKTEISTIWAYLAQFDVTGNPSFLYSAWILFSSLVEHQKLPDFSAEVAIVEFDGEEVRYPMVVANKDTARTIVDTWIKILPRFIAHHTLFWAGQRDPLLEASAIHTFQIGKMTLMKIMSAMGYVLNPFEEKSGLVEQILEGEE